MPGAVVIPWWRGEGFNPALSWFFAILLAAAHWVIAVMASQHNSTTFDEIAHIAGGLGGTLLGDYRLNPENGILPQSLAAAAMVAGGVKLPDVSDSKTHTGLAWMYSDAWELGFTAVYQGDVDAANVLLLGRSACALCGAGTVLVVHAISRWVHRGDSWGSLIPTVLAAACPTTLAHGPLVTSDGAFTFFITLSMACVYAMLHCAVQPQQSMLVLTLWAIATGLSVGGTVVSKHSGVIVAPIAVAVLMLRLWTKKAQTLSFATRALFSISISVCTAYIALWAAYGFRYSAFAYMDCVQWKANWDAGLGTAHGSLKGVPLLLTSFAREHHLLPEALLYGIGYAFLSAQSRQAFLAGEHSAKGWRTFFPYAVLIKTPVGSLVLTVLGLISWVYLKGAWAGSAWAAKAGTPRQIDLTSATRFAPFLVWAIVYWLVAINQNLNIGHRHMLPIYPTMYVLCGFTGRAFANRRRQRRPAPYLLLLLLRLAILTAFVGALLEVWRCFPYFLAFFNAGIGGPAQGYKHLVDSSLDWGQGLPALRDFVANESSSENRLRLAGGVGATHFYLSYFGLGNPVYWNLTRDSGYHIHHLHSSVSGVSLPKHVKELNIDLEPGYYAIGASMLQPVYNKHAAGNWNAHYEATYRRQARFVKRMKTVDDSLQLRILNGQVEGLADMHKLLTWFDGHRLGRLCAHFRETHPYAQPSYAFNVYRVDAATLRRYLFGPAPKSTARNDISYLSIRVD